MEEGLTVITDYLRAIAAWGIQRPLFRGQADENWEILPSAFRPSAYGITSSETLNEWRRLAARFVSPRPADDTEWLVLAAHYGVPTPLLDWTTNPLIALYFACLKVQTVPDGKVFCIDAQLFEGYRYTWGINPFDVDRKRAVLLDSSAMNARTMAQDSAMTLHGPQCPSPLVGPTNTFVVKDPLKLPVMRTLELFGITKGRVFADLAMAAADFKSEIHWQGLEREWSEQQRRNLILSTSTP